jgi:Flp pilus assembly protein CpaB
MAENIGKLGSRFTSGAASSRRNSILVALLAAIVAGGLIYGFVTHFNKSSAPAVPVESTVFVAKSYIPVGMPDAAIVAKGLLVAKQVPATALIAGAISDPSEIAGPLVTTSAIAAGQQVALTDFAKGATSLNTQLTGDARAVAISLDAAHGLTSYLAAGDSVDVEVQGASGTGVLFQNITILANADGDVVLNLTDKQALFLADAVQQNLTIWLELRPAKGAKDSVKLGTVEKIS